MDETERENSVSDMDRGDDSKGTGSVGAKVIRDTKLRFLSLIMFILSAAELGAGAWLDINPSSFSPLAIHVLIAVVLMGVSGYTVPVSFRLPGWHRRFFSILMLLSSVGATIAGSEFVYGGFSSPGLVDIMGDLAAVVLLCSILLMVWGSVTVTLSVGEVSQQ